MASSTGGLSPVLLVHFMRRILPDVLLHKHRWKPPFLPLRVLLRPHLLVSLINHISSPLIPILVQNLHVLAHKLLILVVEPTFGGSLSNAAHLSSLASYSFATVLRAKVFTHSGSEIAILSTAFIAARPNPMN